MQYEVSISMAPPEMGDNLLEALDEAEVLRACRNGLSVWLARVVETAGELAPKDTGVLAGSLVIDVTGDSLDDLAGVAGTPLPYGVVMEFGRTPGKPPPPAGSLLGWMDRHGMEVSEDAERSLRFAIAAKGIVAQPFLVPAFDAHIDEVGDLIAQQLFGAAGVGRGLFKARGALVKGGA